MVRRVLLGCLSVALVACGQGEHHAPPGTLTVSFQPQAAVVADLTLSTAMLSIDRVQPIGNSPPMMPPPPTRLLVDALSPTGASIAFDRLPPGVYSRVQFSVDDTTMQGTWRGTPFVAHVGMFGGSQIDLRASVGAELDPGRDLELTVRIDVASWFDGNVLDGASAAGGQITVDMSSNPQVAGALLGRVASSFSLP